MATGWPMKVSYANGDVYSASDVNDTNGTINLLQTSTLSVQAGKNRVINGGMDVWQRGTTFANPALGYTADRWQGSTATAGTVTRVATGDTTNLPNIQYALRYQRTAASTSTSQLNIIQNFESVNSIPLAGKTVTLSFYARKGANYSPTSSLLGVILATGTGTDQNYYTAGYTGTADTISSSATLTTTWQRFTYTATLPATMTEMAVYFYAAPTGTAGAADYYEITGVQVELGSYATSFSRSAPNYGGELAACQRYYWRIANTDAYAVYGMGIGESTTALGAAVQMPVPMRVKPTAVDYSSVQFSDTNNSPVPTSLTISSFKSSSFIAYLTGGGLTGLTQYRPYELRNNNSASGYIGLSAEL
eukprot:GHVR01046882.1.p1 GENE.GHVR01046882.1~~GHVR01046882.1.p1  ORF type:complete len:362 (-),score=26.81 GHVR01046882.1:772-1857(-)